MLRDLLLSRRLILLQVASLLLLYAAGTYVRLAPISQWGVYVTADDPVLHVRVTEYVYENGHLPRNDTLAWYPWGQNWERALPNFRYYLTAFSYWMARLLGAGMSLYDFCVFFPAFFAPLAIFPMFLLVRQLKDWKAGLVASGVLVLSAGYLTRTVAGFYRHEQVGVPLLILCMYLFVKSMKADGFRTNLGYGISSGMVLVLLTGTWSGFRFLLDGYAVFVFLMIVLGRIDRRLMVAYVATNGLALASTFVWPNLSYYFYTTFEFMIAFVVVIMALFYEYVLRRRVDASKLPAAVVGLSTFLFMVMLVTVSSLPAGRLELVVNPLRIPPPGDVSQTVAEHASMRLSFSGGKMDWPALSSYGIFLFLVPMGIVLPFLRHRKAEDSNVHVLALLVFCTFLLFLALDPYPALVCFALLLLALLGLWLLTPVEHHPTPEDVMMILFALLSAYFFKNMIRLNILFSSFVAIQSGLCLGYAFGAVESIVKEAKLERPEPRSRRRRDRRRRRREIPSEKPAEAPERMDYGQIVLASLIAVLLVWTMMGSYKSARNYPLGLREDWFQALDWIEQNSDPDDVIMSWWDYGYWIQTYANRTTIADGATTNSTQIRKLARAFVTNEKAAYDFCKEYGVRYVMVDVPDDFYPGAKWTAMAVIAEQNVADYMGTSETGTPVIYDRGAQCLLFKLASVKALSQPLPAQHFEYKYPPFGVPGQVIVYEFKP